MYAHDCKTTSPTYSLPYAETCWRKSDKYKSYWPIIRRVIHSRHHIFIYCLRDYPFRSFSYRKHILDSFYKTYIFYHNKLCTWSIRNRATRYLVLFRRFDHKIFLNIIYRAYRVYNTNQTDALYIASFQYLFYPFIPFVLLLMLYKYCD